MILDFGFQNLDLRPATLRAVSSTEADGSIQLKRTEQSDTIDLQSKIQNLKLTPKADLTECKWDEI